MRNRIVALGFFMVFVAAQLCAQQSPSSNTVGATNPRLHLSTVRGCLNGERGNYILIDNNGMVYVLKGVGNALDKQLQHEVEVQGKLLPGSVKTGIRQEKSGSNPADTIHGVDGVPLQVSDVSKDVRVVDKHCKAADQE